MSFGCGDDDAPPAWAEGGLNGRWIGRTAGPFPSNEVTVALALKDDDGRLSGHGALYHGDRLSTPLRLTTGGRDGDEFYMTFSTDLGAGRIEGVIEGQAIEGLYTQGTRSREAIRLEAVDYPGAPR